MKKEHSKFGMEYHLFTIPISVNGLDLVGKKYFYQMKILIKKYRKKGQGGICFKLQKITFLEYFSWKYY